MDTIEDNLDSDINPYEKLGELSKGFYRKVYEVNWGFELSV